MEQITRRMNGETLVAEGPDTHRMILSASSRWRTASDGMEGMIYHAIEVVQVVRVKSRCFCFVLQFEVGWGVKDSSSRVRETHLSGRQIEHLQLGPLPNSVLLNRQLSLEDASYTWSGVICFVFVNCSFQSFVSPDETTWLAWQLSVWIFLPNTQNNSVYPSIPQNKTHVIPAVWRTHPRPFLGRKLFNLQVHAAY